MWKIKFLNGLCLFDLCSFLQIIIKKKAPKCVIFIYLVNKPLHVLGNKHKGKTTV